MGVATCMAVYIAVALAIVFTCVAVGMGEDEAFFAGVAWPLTIWTAPLALIVVGVIHAARRFRGERPGQLMGDESKGER